MADQQSNRSVLGETVSVDGQSGTYIEFDGQSIVTSSADGLQYTVTGPFSQGTLVSIAASIDCAADGANDTSADEEDDSGPASVCEPGSPNEVIGENDEDDDGDGDGAIDEDDEDNKGPSNDDDGDGAVNEDDEPDSGNSDDIDNDGDGDGAVDEDDEANTDD